MCVVVLCCAYRSVSGKNGLAFVILRVAENRSNVIAIMRLSFRYYYGVTIVQLPIGKRQTVCGPSPKLICMYMVGSRRRPTAAYFELNTKKLLYYKYQLTLDQC